MLTRAFRQAGARGLSIIGVDMQTFEVVDSMPVSKKASHALDVKFKLVWLNESPVAKSFQVTERVST